MLHEVKGKLAKLLATENLIIEHRPVETAQFDVVRRVLTLPIWNIHSNDSYDLLVAHEVGHALFTDPRDWSKEDKWRDVPHSFVNITEDARIEKLMKRRYAGLNKTFHRGYAHMHEEDFFDLKDQDVNKFSLADRINLFFKLGSHVDIKFTPREKTVVDAVANAETFDDALEAARLLNCLVNGKEESTQEIVLPQMSQQTDGEDQQKSQQQEESEESTPESPNGDSKESEEETDNDVEEESDTDEHTPVDDLRAKTVDSLSQNLKNISSKEEYLAPEYVTIPKIDLNHTVIPAADVHEYVESVWDSYEGYSEVQSHYLKEYAKFKKESAKEVNYLVKEFECKKSATAYARSTTSRTGVLDCSKLHTYKYNEDLFKKVTVVPDGKSHGLIFVLDWSGSMADVLLSTIKQMYNLIWFCRKVGIPYDVYAFTGEWNYKACRLSPLAKEEGKIHISDDFSMMNILTSKVNNKVADKQMQNIWDIASSFKRYDGITPPRVYLSGTPLNEALITLNSIIPTFKKQTGCEKVNCVILTDGEANIPSRTVAIQRNWESEVQIRNRRITENTFLRNTKTGEVRRLSSMYSAFTKAMLEDLKSNFPDVNFIGFRILDNGAPSMMSLYIPSYKEREIARTSWKRERSFVIKNSGYDSYFVMGSGILSNDAEFEVSEGATKTQIKSAFRKSLKGKKMNKKILNEFVELVA